MMRLSKTAFPALVLLVCCVFLYPASETPTAVPSLADLKRISFRPSESADLGDLPVLSGIQSAVNSFQLVHKGSTQAPDWKWKGVAGRGPKDVAIYKLAQKAVVYIETDTGQEDIGGKLASTGAGSILFPDDLILTAFHVVRAALLGSQQLRDVLVYLKPANQGSPAPSSQLAYKASIDYWNENKDLAILRFVEHPPFALTELKLGKMTNLAVGQDIHVIGHPGGLYWTYTTGIISQIRKGYKTDIKVGGTSDKPTIQSLNGDVLQLQTAINPGNSGGPVLDDAGSIVGVVSCEDSQLQNTDFAIAASEITGLLERRDKSTNSQTATPQTEAKPSLSTARVADGSEVIKLHYQYYDTYIIRGRDGKTSRVVVDAEGTTIRAESPTGDGGFAHWIAEYPDGSTVEGRGAKGFPTAFEIKSKQPSSTAPGQ
ncbi:MAG: trypsin-like peptidase domain-containing protein [Acidobacteria bacterium]|nr:trypsin-like peptidase domain-containing protein [Acidobacteriota bacterium]